MILSKLALFESSFHNKATNHVSALQTWVLSSRSHPWPSMNDQCTIWRTKKCYHPLITSLWFYFLLDFERLRFESRFPSCFSSHCIDSVFARGFFYNSCRGVCLYIYDRVLSPGLPADKANRNDSHFNVIYTSQSCNTETVQRIQMHFHIVTQAARPLGKTKRKSNIQSVRRNGRGQRVARLYRVSQKSGTADFQYLAS